jgi:hypothetical protein
MEKDEQKITLIPHQANVTENDENGKYFDPQYEGKLNVDFARVGQIF